MRRTFVCVLVLAAGACGSQQLPPGTFRLSPLEARTPGETRYLGRAGAKCEFEIAMQNESSGGMTFGSGSIERRPATDCRAFLESLAPALGYKEAALPAPPRESRLTITLATLGANLSRSRTRPDTAGAFASKPSGDWTAMKVFVKDGDGEVFLSINVKDGVGEFSVKDEDYATTVLTELAKVLLPAGS